MVDRALRRAMFRVARSFGGHYCHRATERTIHRTHLRLRSSRFMVKP